MTSPLKSNPLKYTVCPRCKGSGAVEDFKAIGRELRHTRKVRRKGLREIAAVMGISPSYLHDLENGNRPWNKEALGKYRKAIG